MMSSTPYLSQRSRAALTNSVVAEIAQQLPIIGSISMAPMLLLCFLKTSSSRLMSFIGVR